MLTVDMPSIGFSSKCKLTQDTSLLHQYVLQHLANVPWVDHTRVAAFGFRFGANIAVRLGYLESQRLKAVACLGPVVHGLLVDPLHQGRVPEMYLDVLASRLGMHDASDDALRVELNRYSLKVQGAAGAPLPHADALRLLERRSVQPGGGVAADYFIIIRWQAAGDPVQSGLSQFRSRAAADRPLD